MGLHDRTVDQQLRDTYHCPVCGRLHTYAQLQKCKGEQMSRMQRPVRPTGNGTDLFDPAAITQTGESYPDRLILYAPEGWGKTSFAAHAAAPLFLMSAGEDGLLTLQRTGQLPQTILHFPRPATTWTDATRAVQALIVKGSQAKTLVLDTLNGLQQLCFAHVCETQCDREWSKFDAYGRGAKLSLPPWLDFLADLDRLRQLGYAIIALAHAAVERVPNPEAADWERYQPALDRKWIWPATHKWADLILFGNVEVYVKTADAKAPKGKATGGSHRVLYCQPNATYAAKNRHGLPEQIDGGTSAVEAWTNFQNALTSKSQE